MSQTTTHFVYCAEVLHGVATCHNQKGHKGPHSWEMWLEFAIPILPPSVNHYVQHKAQGVHVKTAEAKAFEDSFAAMLPATARGRFVTADRFAVRIRFVPGPGQKGDVDNRNKCLLDCIAKAGMLRDRRGNEVSDAWIKRLLVEIHDSPEERRTGPRTEVTIEALVWQ